MSANIYFEPENVNHASVPVGAPSSFITAMQRTFGADNNWHLSAADLDTLNGMAAAYGGKDRDNPYVFLIQKITDLDCSIHVWAVY